MVAGCDSTRSGSSVESSSPDVTSRSAASLGTEWFVDVAGEAGLEFVHVNGMAGEFHLTEIMAPGVGLLDYDNDGDLDVFLVQGDPRDSQRAPKAAPRGKPDDVRYNDRLFRNDLQVQTDGKRVLRFVDVTLDSGIRSNGYGMGVTTGDFDNDGWVDIYVTRFGSNQLWRNNRDGTFDDVSRHAGVDEHAWSTSASFVDIDRNGWLDLYVGNYLNYGFEARHRCFSLAGMPDYCSPNAYRAQRDRLYRNLGNGTFADITAKALTTGEDGPALGVSTADFDGDGWYDIYVANDGQANQLWLNQRDGTFRDAGLFSGSALSAEGKPEASMGVDAGDFDNDGDEDLFMTHLANEGNNLYVNEGAAAFVDRSARSGLEQASLAYTGFGTGWFDFDGDGWLDLLTVNGAVRIILSLAQGGDTFPLHQRRQLFQNRRNGRFEDVSERAGKVFQMSEVGRGAAFGDVDNDGDTDVIVTNNHGPVRLLRNEIGNRKHWLGLRLLDGDTGRDMLGARVKVTRRDGFVTWRRARSDGSYLSANDPRVLIGLGDSADAVNLSVEWPDGHAEQWAEVSVDRWMAINRGSGR
jgi:hypothetical protein